MHPQIRTNAIAAAIPPQQFSRMLERNQLHSVDAGSMIDTEASCAAIIATAGAAAAARRCASAGTAAVVANRIREGASWRQHNNNERAHNRRDMR
eukprot:6206336-Pleurochrysis_carterae.AAC.1